MTAPSIVWFRRDLRLADQAAVRAAAEAGPVLPVYILDDETPERRTIGGAARWWLYHSLRSLADDLDAKGSKLILRAGRSATILADLAEQTGASAIHALRHYEPWWRNAEDELRDALGDDRELVLHDGNYLAPPGSVTTGGGTPYKVYSPFWSALQDVMPPAAPEPAPDDIARLDDWPDSDHLDDWGLLPTNPNWAEQFGDAWTPGESAAHERVDAFADLAREYGDERNLPSNAGTSRLSPHLHWGEISPAAVWHGVSGKDPSSYKTVQTYLSELAWRDFAQNIILQFPDYGEEGYRDTFADFPWRDMRSSAARDDLEAWKRGRTGYPIVDAGMRELWAIGWMHNRVRMITASFLIKHLLIDWREGERHFWDCLVDADYGSNTTNWQWTSGTGVASNMFSRIMAPLTQSEKFSAGDYIREWVPELADLDDDVIHDPDAHGARPDDYPAKRIGHREARERALDAYRSVK